MLSELNVICIQRSGHSSSFDGDYGAIAAPECVRQFGGNDVPGENAKSEKPDKVNVK